MPNVTTVYSYCVIRERDELDIISDIMTKSLKILMESCDPNHVRLEKDLLKIDFQFQIYPPLL